MHARLTSIAVALAVSLALPASAALAQSSDFDRPLGYTEDGRLNVFGARIDPPNAGYARDDAATGSIGQRGVNAPAAGYGVPAY